MPSSLATVLPFLLLGLLSPSVLGTFDRHDTLAGSDEDLQAGMLIEQLVSLLHAQVISQRVGLADAEFFAEAFDL